MRRSREEAAATRARIVAVAARLFRARGIDATSVADVMSALGLTVGGFYRHFDSKEALVTEAIDAASRETTDRHLTKSAAREGGERGGAAVTARPLSLPRSPAAPRPGLPRGGALLRGRARKQGDEEGVHRRDRAAAHHRRRRRWDATQGLIARAPSSRRRRRSARWFSREPLTTNRSLTSCCRRCGRACSQPTRRRRYADVRASPTETPPPRTNLRLRLRTARAALA